MAPPNPPYISPVHPLTPIQRSGTRRILQRISAPITIAVMSSSPFVSPFNSAAASAVGTTIAPVCMPVCIWNSSKSRARTIVALTSTASCAGTFNSLRKTALSGAPPHILTKWVNSFTPLAPVPANMAAILFMTRRFIPSTASWGRSL